MSLSLLDQADAMLMDRKQPKRRTCLELVILYNRATNPRAFRTDHEAFRNRQLARAVRARLRRDYTENWNYCESDSGRLYVPR